LSINAYPVIDFELGTVSFNLFRDRGLSDFLDTESGLYDEIHDGSDLVNIPVNVLKKALRQPGKLNLKEKTVKRLQSDIASAKSNSDEVVTYYCF
jgi:hypothetical protein